MVRSIKKQQSKLRVCSEKKLKSRSRKSSKRISTLNNVSSRKKKQMGGRLKNFKDPVEIYNTKTWFESLGLADAVSIPIEKQFREGTIGLNFRYREDSKNYNFKFDASFDNDSSKLNLYSEKNGKYQMKKIKSRNEREIKNLLYDELGIVLDSHQALLKQLKICLKIFDLGPRVLDGLYSSYLWDYIGQNIEKVSISYQDVDEIHHKFVVTSRFQKKVLEIYLLSLVQKHKEKKERYRMKKIEPRNEVQIKELLKEDLGINLDSQEALLEQLRSCLNIVSYGMLKNLHEPLDNHLWLNHHSSVYKFYEAEPVTISVPKKYILKDSNLVEDSNLGENKDFNFKISFVISNIGAYLYLINKQENFYNGASIFSGLNEDNFVYSWESLRGDPTNSEHPIQKINELIGVDLDKVSLNPSEESLKEQLTPEQKLKKQLTDLLKTIVDKYYQRKRPRLS